MKKLITLLLITILTSIYFIGHTEERELGLQEDGRVTTETSEGYTLEMINNRGCQWAMVHTHRSTLKALKRTYLSDCKNPKYESEGANFLTVAIMYHKVDMVEWLATIPGMDVNFKYSGQTILYIAVTYAHNTHIGYGDSESEESDIQIVKLLLEHGADPMLHNDTEGHGNYSNGRSAYDFVNDPVFDMKNTTVGRLVLEYAKGN